MAVERERRWKRVAIEMGAIDAGFDVMDMGEDECAWAIGKFGIEAMHQVRIFDLLMQLERQQCEHPGENHSADIVEVYHGAPEPMTLCGFHVSQLGPELYLVVEGAKAAAHG